MSPAGFTQWIPHQAAGGAGCQSRALCPHSSALGRLVGPGAVEQGAELIGEARALKEPRRGGRLRHGRLQVRSPAPRGGS